MRTIVTDLQSIESLNKYADAKDRVYIITTPDGQLPISVANTIMSLKTKPEFVVVAEAEMKQPFALGLRFGFLCANAPGSLMLILSGSQEQLKALHGLQYPVKGGIVTVEISGMKSAGKTTRAKRKPVVDPSSAKESETSAEFMNAPEPEPVHRASIPSVSSSDPTPAPKRRARAETPADEPKDETSTPKKQVKISAKFRKALLSIDESLIDDIDGIAEAVGEAIDGSITLEMQLQLHTSKERGGELFPILSPHYTELKAAL